MALKQARLCGPPKRIDIVAAMPREEDRHLLRRIFHDHFEWTLHTTSTIAETVNLVECNSARVVLCERALPDGTWKDLLSVLAARGCPAQLVVASRLAPLKQATSADVVLNARLQPWP